jgi:Chaperone of endosialidase
MIAALEDSPRAREIVRQAFLPSFPIQGGTQTQNYIALFTADNGPLGNSVMLQYGSRIGVGTTTPSFPFDVNGNVFGVGPTSAQPGAGGTMRFRDDTGTVRWTFGIPGTGGSTDFFIYNNVNGHGPLFIANGAPSYMLYADGSGHLGIGIGTPLLRLDARGSTLKSTIANFENIFQAASTDPTGPLALRAGIKTDSDQTKRYGAIEVDDAGTKLPLALQLNGSGVVIGGTTTKQTNSDGPEHLSLQDASLSHVCLGTFLTTDTSPNDNGRFLLSTAGTMEWSLDGSDQSMELYIANTGRMNFAGEKPGWLGIVGRVSGVKEAQPRIILNNEGTGIQMTDGVNGADVAIARPVKGRVHVSGGLTSKTYSSFSATGTVSVTSPLNVVNGDPGPPETVFFKEIVVGDRVTVNGQTKRVTLIGADDSLTVDSNFSAAFSAKPMTVMPSVALLQDSSGNPALLVSDQGYVGAGTKTPSNTLEVKAGGTTLADAWTIRSSLRWKTNVRPLDGALQMVERLHGVRFDWRDSGNAGIGLIAEEAKSVVPEVVALGPDDGEPVGVDYGRLVALLVEAIKELQEQVAQLRVEGTRSVGLSRA